MALRAQTNVQTIIANAQALAAADPVTNKTIPVFSFDLPPVSRRGTYWSLQLAHYPPLPESPFPELPVYEIDPTNHVYLYDDRSVDYAGLWAWLAGQAEAEKALHKLEVQFGLAEAGAMDSDDSGGGGTFGAMDSLEDDTNVLWLEIQSVSFTSNLVYLVIHGTAADIAYEVLSRQNLSETGWTSEGLVLGADGHDWTPTTVPVGTRTNSLFLWARSWVDSQGTGIPDWWWLKYFGAIGDPYADPDNDGWNNLQEFQNGTNPNQFNIPPAPTGLTVLFNGQTNASISWNASPGPVTGYTVEKLHNQFLGNSYTNDFSFSAGVNGFGDVVDDPPFYPPLSGPTIYVAYRIQAHYPGGDSDWSDDVLLEPSYYPSFGSFGNLPVSLIGGPDGSAYLAANALPPGTVALRLTRIDGYAEYYGDFSFDTNFDISVSAFTNGLYHLPLSWTTVAPDAYGAAAYDWYVQALGASNSPSAAMPLEDFYYFNYSSYTTSFAVPPFFDGRAQLKQNLNFLLRAATKSYAFQFFEFTNSSGNISVYYSTINPSNYTYASYYSLEDYSGTFPAADLEVFLPFSDNNRYRNFVFGLSDLDSYGRITTGAGGDYFINVYVLPGGLYLQDPPAYNFLPPETNGATIPALLATNQTRWLCSYALDSSPIYSGEIGVDWDGTNFFMASADENIYGLPFLSAKVAYGVGGVLQTNTLYAGSSIPEEEYSYFYPETEQPKFQTIEYDFWQAEADWLPGHGPFSTTNANHLLIASVGTPFRVAGYAKLAIQNGDPNKFGYLGQYFEKAYKITTDGVPTTDETGVLSPYGGFFPTEPGPVALQTMPDIDTNLRGTGVVQVIKLQLDVNHDGEMDLSFAGPDNTSQARPFVFWVNNDRDDPGTGGNLDHDVYLPPNVAVTNNDYSFGQIRCQRNLEDFARLWICGVPSLAYSNGYTVALTLNTLSGSPAINLYLAAESNGGIGYLTNIAIAGNQVTNPLTGNVFIRITNGVDYILPSNFFDGSDKHFLFEGAGICKGELVLKVYRSTNMIAQTSAWMDFHDIRDFYEEAAITNVIQTWPGMVQTNLNSSFSVVSHPTASIGEVQQMAVFVHGWRMSYGDYQIFSQTMFKRLYWQGYQGKFTTVRWPTRSSDTDPPVVAGLLPTDVLTYNRSERIAFKSGMGVAAYFTDLRSRFPDYTISVCSHSMGGIVMMEALKQLADEDQKPLDNYLLMQVAVPAHCYDTSVTNYPPFISAEGTLPTPNTYANYAAGITNALRPGGKVINFFNPIDFALTAGIGGSGTGSWEYNEKLIISTPILDYPLLAIKPNLAFGYYTDGVSSYVTNNYWNAGWPVIPRTITDPKELMPFVARPRSKAIGAQGGVGGVVRTSREIDLESALHFTRERYDHSGQFNRNIQDTAVWPFYSELESALFAP